MKALLVNGSPHKNGCTHTALGLVGDLIEAQKIYIEPVYTRVARHIELHYLTRVILRPIINDDDLVVWIVLRQQYRQVMREVESLIMRRNDHRHSGSIIGDL